jgi:hypothetical protein
VLFLLLIFFILILLFVVYGFTCFVLLLIHYTSILFALACFEYGDRLGNKTDGMAYMACNNTVIAELVGVIALQTTKDTLPTIAQT